MSSPVSSRVSSRVPSLIREVPGRALDLALATEEMDLMDHFRIGRKSSGAIEEGRERERDWSDVAS